MTRERRSMHWEIHRLAVAYGWSWREDRWRCRGSVRLRARGPARLRTPALEGVTSVFSGIAARASSEANQPSSDLPSRSSSSIAVGRRASRFRLRGRRPFPLSTRPSRGALAPETSGLSQRRSSIELGPLGARAAAHLAASSRVPSVIVERSANTASDSSLSPSSVSVPISTGHTPLADGTVQRPPARLEWVAQSGPRRLRRTGAPGTPSEAALPTSVQGRRLSPWEALGAASRVGGRFSWTPGRSE